MDVHVGEVRSTVRVSDGGLGGATLDQVVALVLARLREEHAHERRVEDERLLRPSASASEGRTWEAT